MYAVVKSGGKQYKIAAGDRIEIEKVNGDLDLAPVLVVDGAKVVTGAADLAKIKIEASVVGDSKGPKINGFTYKNKSNERRRYGHRQKYSVVEIKSIGGAAKRATKAKAADDVAPAETEAAEEA